jgi:hypothetical protein
MNAGFGDRRSVVAFVTLVLLTSGMTSACNPEQSEAIEYFSLPSTFNPSSPAVLHQIISRYNSHGNIDESSLCSEFSIPVVIRDHSPFLRLTLAGTDG